MYLLKLTQILISVSHVSHSRVFCVIQITEVRLPQDSNGRLKGFGYAEFVDKESLVAALTLNNEVIFLTSLQRSTQHGSFRIWSPKTHVQFDTEKNLLTLGCVEQVHVHVAFALACWT